MPTVLIILGLMLSVWAVIEGHRAIRRGAARTYAQKRLLADVSDPVEATAVMSFYMSALGGEVLAADRERLVDLLARLSRAPHDAADEAASFAMAMLEQVEDIPASLPRLIRALKEQLTLDEMKGVIGHLSEVSLMRGPPTVAQREWLAMVARALHLAHPAADQPVRR